MFLTTDSESTHNLASYRMFCTTFASFVSDVQPNPVFGGKQDFAVHLKTDQFQTEPKVQRNPPCSNVPTMKRSGINILDFQNTLCVSHPFIFFLQFGGG